MTVRGRITVIASLVTAAILVGASFLLVAALDRSLTASTDDVSRAKIGELAVLAAQGSLPRHLGDAGNGVIQVVAQDGQVLAASTNVDGRPRITSFEPSGGSPTVRIVNGAPDDTETENYRVWAGSSDTSTGPVTIYVGDSLEAVHEATASLRRALVVGVPVTLLVLVTAIWFLVGRALGPVEAIRAEVAGISERQLDRRVPVPPTEDEIGRLARTMNDMLDRLERARNREREFVADASHELLSPVTASRAMLEVDQQVGVDGHDELVAGLLAENAQMERIVRDLLFLAREEAAEPAAPTGLDLDDIVLEEATRLRSLTPVLVDTSRVSAGPVRGDREELRRLVRNLLENAVRYAATTVRVTLHTEGSTVRLVVSDDGPGVDPVDRAHVFDRFYRADTARSRGSSGSGLGLAIAAAIATRHGGTISLQDSEPGAEFLLVLPMGDLGIATSPRSRVMP